MSIPYLKCLDQECFKFLIFFFQSLGYLHILDVGIWRIGLSLETNSFMFHLYLMHICWRQFYILFLANLCFIWKAETEFFHRLLEGDKEIERDLPSAGLLPNTCNTEGWIKSKPGAQNSVLVSYSDGRDSSIPITCCFLRCTLAGNWI